MQLPPPAHDAEQRVRRALATSLGAVADQLRKRSPPTRSQPRVPLRPHRSCEPRSSSSAAQHQRPPPRLPAHQRASDDSIRARLRGTLEENKRLRAENAQLREELALAHGRVRELELTHRRRSTR